MCAGHARISEPSASFTKCITTSPKITQNWIASSTFSVPLSPASRWVRMIRAFTTSEITVPGNTAKA